MSRVYVDATTLIALGRLGELALLTNFDGDSAVVDGVRAEVTTEPARTNIEEFCDREDVLAGAAAAPGEDAIARARTVLDAGDVTGDVELVAAVVERSGESVGVVSDDGRVRTVADGLGATVTGTVGVVVRAVEEGLDAEQGTDLVRRLDDYGLHMTAELRMTAERLIEEAADEGS